MNILYTEYQGLHLLCSLHHQHPHPACFIHLEQLSQGLHQLKIEILGQAPHVVVALDGVAVLAPTARGRAALYHIWIQCALQHVHTMLLKDLSSRQHLEGT